MHQYITRLLFCSIAWFAGATNFAQADTLVQIFDLASSNDPQIRAAEAALKANLQNRTINRAALLPQIGLRADYTETVNEIDNPDPITDSDSDFNTTTYSASINQVLFDLPSWYRYKSGDAQADQAEIDYLAAKQDLVVRTTDAYLNVLRTIDDLATARAEQKSFASQLDQTQQRFEVGLIAITDLLEAQAAYDNVIARLLQAEGNLGIAFEGLSVLTGQNHTSIAPLSSEFPVINPEPGGSDSWVETALANSKALASSTLSRDAARYNSKSSTSEHLPTISLSLSKSESQPEGNLGRFREPFDSEAEQISVTVDLPIFSGGLISGQRRQAYYQYMQAEESLNNTRRSLIQNTRSLYLSVITDVSTVNARKQSIVSNASALEATRAGYEVGSRNLVDVLDAERALFAAQRDYFNARYDYVLNILNLKRTAGILGADDIAYLNRYLEASAEIPKSVLTTSTSLHNSIETDYSSQAENNAAELKPAITPKNLTPRSALENWIAAWEARDAEQYLSYYSPRYINRSANADWQQTKRNRIARASRIEIEIDSIVVVSETLDSALIRFTQHYTDDFYSDITEKEIRWTKENGEWKILVEKALEIRER